MRRILSIILCLMIACTAAVSAGEGLTLPIKMQRQMQHDGNGVKGTFRLTANAEAEKNPLLSILQNAEFSLLRNISGEDWHLSVFQNDKQDQQVNKTEIYRNETGIYVRSDFLPGRTFLLPDAESMIPASLNGTGENPAVLPTILAMAGMTDAEKKKWEPVIRKYSAMLETWLAQYAAAPEMQRSADGRVLMNLIYVVPADDVRTEIVSLIRAVASDPDAVSLLAGRMTEEQRAVYLNAGLEAYYTEVLAGLSLEQDLQFVKTVTTMGETVNTELTLPLDPGTTGYSSAVVFSREKESGFLLRGDTEIIRAVVPNGLTDIQNLAEFDGAAYILYCSSEESRQGENFSVRLSIRKTTETYTDEESGKGHETEKYTVRAERDIEDLPEGVSDTDIPAFEPAEAVAELHYSGKNGPNAPTTLEITAAYTRGGFRLEAAGKIKTASTWPFVPFSTAGAEELAAMSDGEKATALAEWMQNAGTGMIHTGPDGEGTEE